MMLKINYRMALNSLRASRWRSFLTMFGVIIGVVAIVTVISVGEGIKHAIVAEAESLGSDVITILPGEQVRRENGQLTQYNPFAGIGVSLTETDLAAVRDIPGVASAIPFVRVSGMVQAGDQEATNATVLAIDGDVPSALNRDIRFGTWHEDDATSNRAFVVIGSEIAQDLFGELAPIGRTMSVAEQSFTVRGVFESFPGSPLPFMSTDYNHAVFVSYHDYQRSSNAPLNIHQILVIPDESAAPDEVVADITVALDEERGGSSEITVLKRAEAIDVYRGLLDILTAGIAAVAAISLFVGGVGIMNIMFVSVSERTGEIGIRKAIGASNSQILGQFMTEAVILSTLGGIFGIVGSLLVNYFIRLFTILEPLILPEVLIGAGLIAFAIGVLFGTVPAIRAARKDPIDALRYRI